MTFALLAFRDLPENPTADDIEAAINASGAVDGNRILKSIREAGDPVAAYRAFQAWAEKAGDVTKSTTAGVSFAFGVETPFTETLKVQFSSFAANATESGALDIAVTVKDGGVAKPVSAANVAEMFEATSDLADWDDKKLAPTVTVRTPDKVATPVEFSVKPGDGKAPSAYLRLRK